MRACASPSMAHGPPIRQSGAPPPIVTAPTRTARVGNIGSRPRLVIECRLNEAVEERVRLPRARAELGVELPGDEPRMVGQLDDLDELLLRPDPGDLESALLERVQVVVVDLVAVPVALADDPLPVRPRGVAALLEDD